jgi:hypothetical protein
LLGQIKLVGEVPGSLRIGRNERSDGLGLSDPQAFVIDEEKSSVAYDRAAKRESELVLFVRSDPAVGIV